MLAFMPMVRRCTMLVSLAMFVPHAMFRAGMPATGRAAGMVPAASAWPTASKVSSATGATSATEMFASSVPTATTKMSPASAAAKMSTTTTAAVSAPAPTMRFDIRAPNCHAQIVPRVRMCLNTAILLRWDETPAQNRRTKDVLGRRQRRLGDSLERGLANSPKETLG